MFRSAIALGLLTISVTSASAQTPPVTEVVEGAGIKIGEGTVLHPIIGIETGVVQNVFYEESDAEISGLMRVIGELAVGSLPPERMGPVAEQDEETRNFGDLAIRADLHVQYEEYLSGNELVREQRNLSFAGAIQGIVFPKNTWRFGFFDEIRRETRPVNFESPEQVNRDINKLALRLQFRPRGRSLSGQLSYTNLIDYFEDEDQQFANRIHHTAALQVAWQWLPLTRFTFDASFGYFAGLGSESTRPTSTPLRLLGRVQTALTVKTMLNGYVGFGTGFYEGPKDFTNVIGGLQMSYRFSPTALIAAGYEYDFADSINASFYRDHAIQARMEQQIDRFAFNIGGELRFRRYNAVIVEVDPMQGDRDDVIVAVIAGATYNFRNWIAATLDYRLAIVQTDFRYMIETGVVDDPSYTQQIIMAGLRAAY
jgi:hypothetical protein